MTPADDLRAWVAGQVVEYGRRLPSYRRYAETLDAALRRAVADLAPLALTTARAKSLASFAEKALRKRAEHPDPVNQFTDLCGGRVICRTRTEVDAVAEHVVDNFEIDWENSSDTSERLRPAEFGYRSVHYIVSFRPDVDYGVEVPDDVHGLKGEVQLRTVAEHAYADFAHDLTYKGAFPLPLAWQRELAGAAATLEEVDGVFGRIEQGLREYATSFGAYLTEDEMHEEAGRLGIVLEHDPQNAELAGRVAKLAIALGAWDRAIEVLSPLVDQDIASTPQPVLRDLGVALCRRHRDRSDSDEFQRGQQYLELAAAPEHGDVDAVCSLAGTWKGIDDARARDLYRQGFELDPADPYALGNYLELELPHHPALLDTVRPLLRRAVERGRRHVEAGINLPWAHYDLGRFHLLLDEPFDSLDAYARALRTSAAAFMVETSLASLERLTSVVGSRPGYEWARRLLTLGLASRFPSPDRTGAAEAMATRDAPLIAAPVAIVAGGTDPRVEPEMRGYARLLQRAFDGYEGTIISGGTKQGISGVVARIGQASDSVHTIGYLPELVPSDATADARYDELRQTAGHGFTPLEPLQNWVDLLSSGVDPATVRVLGVNGGPIAGAEYRIALALGAWVGLVADSGREAGRLLADDDWASAPRLLRLPADAETIRAFLAPPPARLEAETRERVARAVHDAYRAARTADRTAADPAVAVWDDLDEGLRESNRQQADDIAAKLRTIGCTVVPVDSPGEPARLTDADVERLAEMEHGRWNVERLRAGWTWGETRDANARTSPYLVEWVHLPDDVQEYDRQAVREIPELLAAIGLSIRRGDLSR
jgi:ppGpp synthetase/RelA/SpoT-type nucleotidyltranferase